MSYKLETTCTWDIKEVNTELLSLLWLYTTGKFLDAEATPKKRSVAKPRLLPTCNASPHVPANGPPVMHVHIQPQRPCAPFQMGVRQAGRLAGTIHFQAFQFIVGIDYSILRHHVYYESRFWTCDMPVMHDNYLIHLYGVHTQVP